MALLDVIFAFLLLIVAALALAIAWAIFSTMPRKPKLEAKVPRSRRRLNIIVDDQDGAIYQVTRRRILGEFKWLLTLKGGKQTVTKIVWAWQLIPANSLAAVAGSNVSIWKLVIDPTLTYQKAEKKYQEIHSENQKLNALVATFEAEEGEKAREIVEATAKLVGKAKEKDTVK